MDDVRQNIYTYLPVFMVFSGPSARMPATAARSSNDRLLKSSVTFLTPGPEAGEPEKSKTVNMVKAEKKRDLTSVTNV